VRWSKKIPWDRIPGDFVVKGTEDTDAQAFDISVVDRVLPADYRTSGLQPYESVTFGLSLLIMYDVVGRGKDAARFARRPIYEAKGCLWARAPARSSVPRKARPK